MSNVHFELPADDIERAKKFWEELMGVETMTVPGFEDYPMFTLPAPERFTGAIVARQAPMQSLTLYLYVDSLDEHAKKVEALGGKIIVPKTAVPKMGYFVHCTDTENNLFALWEDDPNAE
jgi:predicted enzyme related to lactoylglutathione lyase